LRTIVYVDGFNLFYGNLKGTKFKWFDLCSFFDATLPKPYQLEKVKYFTARVKCLPNSPDATQKQDIYLRALRAHSRNRIEIIEGRFSVKNVFMPLANEPSKKVKIIKTEEKGSDVNLAVELLNDAWEDRFDCAALVSNDADLERSLQIVKQQRKKKVILYTPGTPERKPLAALSRWSDKQIGITMQSLSPHQLPNTIPQTKIFKPSKW
jgi:uncharacterized LabA/DUF88 family protein